MGKLLSMKIESEIKKKLFDTSPLNGEFQNDDTPVDINYFIKDNDMIEHIDDIWARISNDLKTKGFSDDKINNIIKEVRKEQII